MGKLEQAKMQERVNATLVTLSRPVDTGGPTLREIEDKIDRRMALASAHAELAQSSVTSGQVEIDRAMREVAANARLASLRQELGIEAPAAGRGDRAARGPGARGRRQRRERRGRDGRGRAGGEARGRLTRS